MASLELATHLFFSAPSIILWILSSLANVNFSIFRVFWRLCDSQLRLRSRHPQFSARPRFFWFVTLFVSLLWMMERFSSTFSVKTAISDALKFCFQPLRETAGEAILAHAKLSPWSRHANVSNLGLAAFNPRLTNRCTNPLTNNAYLSPS